MTVEELKRLLAQRQKPTDLREQIRNGGHTPALLAHLRQLIPNLTDIPHLTYTIYRIFEESGERGTYESAYFLKRGMLARAVLEYIVNEEDTTKDAIHDLIWNICEETSWVLPAHEEQGPDYWDIDPPIVRDWPLGAHTMLTREPDSIDLFAAETAATLAETLYLIGDDLSPEVVQRARQEVQRRVFEPYLAYGRDHWWFHGALNWNGVCNGAVGLAFVRLEHDLQTLAEALSMVLKGFEAYIATGFEPDGGSIEGVGYWNYGLMYYVALGEVLHKTTGGEIDLLAGERMREIVRYPLVMALTPPMFGNFGDATEEVPLASGMTQRLAERTGVDELRALLLPPTQEITSYNAASHFASVLRSAAWRQGNEQLPDVPHENAYLPVCRVARLTARYQEQRPAVLIASAGHNDGHHSHTDIGSFIYHVAGESLIADGGRGLYSKMYFRQTRYENIFNNSYTHNVPRIGGQLQAAGPEFGGTQQFYGSMVHKEGTNWVEMEMQHAYDLPRLTQLKRTLTLNEDGFRLTDNFAFEGEPLEIEEAFITWLPVTLEGDRVHIHGQQHTLILQAAESAEVALESLEQAATANKCPPNITRITFTLPAESRAFNLAGAIQYDR